MAKISALPVATPNGSENVVVLKDGKTQQVNIRGLVGSVGTTTLGAVTSGNNVDLQLSGSFTDGGYYRFVSPLTNTGPITINARPLLGPDGNQVSNAGAIVNGGDVVVRFRITGVVFVLVSSATRRIDAVETSVAALTPQLARNTSNLLVTRDPWATLYAKIARAMLGTISYAGGVRTVTPPKLVIGVVGNSHMLGQGTRAALRPAEQLRAKLQALLPGWIIEIDSYAVAGSWASQIGGQIDKFTRVPDIVLVGNPMNDATTNIFNSYQGYVGAGASRGGYEAAIEDVFTRLQNMGCAVVNLTAPYPHPTRSLAAGRFDFAQNLVLSWPVASFVAYFVTLTYSASTQRITSSSAGLFNTYSNGLLGVGSALLEFDPNSGAEGTRHQIVEIDSAGTWVRVNGTIGADKSAVGGLRQVGFDQESIVYPPKSQAFVQQDVSGTGNPVSVSWRHLVLNAVNMRVAARNGVKTIDWCGVQSKRLTSNAAYDSLFADDYHNNDTGYLDLDAPCAELAAWIVSGAARTAAGVTR